MRLLWLTAMYLFAGAITTVAVAWLMVWLMGSVMPDPLVNDFRVWSRARDDGVDRDGTVLLTEWRRRGSWIVMINFSQVPYEPSPIQQVRGALVRVPAECRSYLRQWIDDVAAPSDFRSVDLRGWPALSMWCSPDETGGASRVHEARFGVAVETLPPPAAGWFRRSATLPLAPLWRGFVIDTLFYAAIWFVLLFGFVQTKRFIRRRRGRCVMCGYQLENISAGCSECGRGRKELNQ